MSKSYRRKISSTEARTGRFMVLKSALGFFPPIGERFTIISGEDAQETCVEAEPCTCHGPEKPHEHYFVPWPGLEKGMMIELTPAADGSADYVLSML
ncbi:MAG TPA: hypothetical protein DEP45_03995 [Armatimonadetes bacterium]|nr:hypothetical protein [Armatimonadota bacterium]